LTEIPFDRKIAEAYSREEMIVEDINMPIYEFECKNCGNIFEYLCLKSSDKEQACCPLCGRKETDLLLSAFSSMSSINSQGGEARSSSSSCSPSGGFS